MIIFVVNFCHFAPKKIKKNSIINSLGGGGGGGKKLKIKKLKKKN